MRAPAPSLRWDSTEMRFTARGTWHQPPPVTAESQRGPLLSWFSMGLPVRNSLGSSLVQGSVPESKTGVAFCHQGDGSQSSRVARVVQGRKRRKWPITCLISITAKERWAHQANTALQVHGELVWVSLGARAEGWSILPAQDGRAVCAAGRGRGTRTPPLPPAFDRPVLPGGRVWGRKLKTKPSERIGETQVSRYKLLLVLIVIAAPVHWALVSHT